jgi:hypothetical protein
MNRNNTPHTARPRGLYQAMILLVLAMAGPFPATSQTVNGIFPAGSTIYGKTYNEWCIAFHQWLGSLEVNHHPTFDTADLSTGQSGPVWFLQGLNADPNRPGIVPAGTAMLLMLARGFSDPTGCPPWPGWTEEFGRTYLANDLDQVYNCSYEIDGAQFVIPLPEYRFQPPAFTLVTPPNSNILQILEGEPCYNDYSATPTPWTVNGAVSDDIAVMLTPLPIGSHTVSCSLQHPTAGTFHCNYYLTVVETNLGNASVFPPDSAPYGKTSAQWSAAKYKWAYSLPRDRNPLADTAALSEGQSGDVWFLGGTLKTTTNVDGVVWGTAARYGTVPDGKALFVPLIDVESATAEGHGTNGQLWARSQFLINRATNVSAVIDGQPVNNVEHYRVRSPEFTWGPLPANNVFADTSRFAAGLISQSVADGYYLMLRPLPLGTHTLNFKGGIRTSTTKGDPSNFEFEQDITYYLTVTPAALSLARSGSNWVLSWSEFSTTYRLQESTSLASANWADAASTRMTNGNVVSVSVADSANQTFYRLAPPISGGPHQRASR